MTRSFIRQRTNEKSLHGSMNAVQREAWAARTHHWTTETLCRWPPYELLLPCESGTLGVRPNARSSFGRLRRAAAAEVAVDLVIAAVRAFGWAASSLLRR